MTKKHIPILYGIILGISSTAFLVTHAQILPEPDSGSVPDPVFLSPQVRAVMASSTSLDIPSASLIASADSNNAQVLRRLDEIVRILRDIRNQTKK